MTGSELIDRQLHPQLLQGPQGRAGALGVVDHDALGDLSVSGSVRVSVRMRSTRSTRPGSRCWRADRLTDTRSGDPLCAPQARACRQAWRNANSPIFVIRPVSSAATGTRTARPRRARDGPSAEEPPGPTMAAARSTCGWYSSRNSRSSIAPVQIGLGARPRAHAAAHSVVEDLVGHSLALCAVHRRVGVANQALGALVVATADHDAHAGRDGQLVPIDHERLGDRARSRSAMLITCCSSATSSHSTMNSSPPKRAAAGAQPVLQAPAERLQQQVADVVAEAVVDRLEPVEVEEHHAQQVCGACAHHGMLQPVLEQGGWEARWARHVLLWPSASQRLALGRVGDRALRSRRRRRDP